MSPIRVVLFTIIHRASSHLDGGIICLRNHIQRLSEDPNVELLVIVAASENVKVATEAELRSTGCNFCYITFEPEHNFSRTSYLVTRIIGFPWENESIILSVKKSLNKIIQSWKPDYIVVDYLFSALFFENENNYLPIIMSTLNREAEFYLEWWKWQPSRIKVASKIKAYRLERFEKKTYQSASGVIALSQPDVPAYIDQKKTGVITPFLDTSKKSWEYSASRKAFFVGNINHYPNQEAINFIAKKLAPEVALLNANIRFSIIGASENQIPSSWKHPLVDYLGSSNEAELAEMFQTCDIMLCPVTNNFGMKFKIAEAVSYGTPFLATMASMQCVPYLLGMPMLEIENPKSSAKLLLNLMEDRLNLENLSNFITQRNIEFTSSQRDIWSRTLKRIVSQ